MEEEAAVVVDTEAVAVELLSTDTQEAEVVDMAEVVAVEVVVSAREVIAWERKFHKDTLSGNFKC